MVRRTREEWLGLFERQQESGLSVSEFCEREGINSNYFSQRRTHFGWNSVVSESTADRRGGFVEVMPPVLAGAVRLSWNEVDVEIPAGTSVSWVARLMRELADAAVQ